MYTPRPLPTFNPSNQSVDDNFYQLIDGMFKRACEFLDAVPVVPNANGYFDPSTGAWLTPVVSVLDIMIAMFVVGTLISLLVKLASGSFNIGGGILNYAKGKS